MFKSTDRATYDIDFSDPDNLEDISEAKENDEKKESDGGKGGFFYGALFLKCLNYLLILLPFLIFIVGMYITLAGFLRCSFFLPFLEWVSILGLEKTHKIIYYILLVLSDFGMYFIMTSFIIQCGRNIFVLVTQLFDIHRKDVISSVKRGDIVELICQTWVNFAGLIFLNFFCLNLIIISIIDKELYYNEYIGYIVAGGVFLHFCYSAMRKIFMKFNFYYGVYSTNIISRSILRSLLVENMLKNFEKFDFRKTFSVLPEIIMSILVIVPQIIKMISTIMYTISNEKWYTFLGVALRLTLLYKAVDLNIYYMICHPIISFGNIKNNDSFINELDDYENHLSRSQQSDEVTDKEKNDINSSNANQNDVTESEIDDNNLLVLVAFIIIIVIYLISVGAIIFFYLYFFVRGYPEIGAIEYEENNTDFNSRLRFIDHYGDLEFCNIQAKLDDSLSVVDAAMMTTLPRLYGIHERKCFIKPKLRGVFNVTMQYIFGPDYESQGIKIFCHAGGHDPILVITSEKMLNLSRKLYNYTYPFHIKPEFNITSTDYFANFSFDNLTNNESKEKYMEYENCTIFNGNCTKKWANFTNFYWMKEFNDSYDDKPVFEQYQISFYSRENGDTSIYEYKYPIIGNHYIVGGGFQNSWGNGLLIGCYVEILLPSLVASLIPLYELATRQYLSFFNSIWIFIDTVFQLNDLSDGLIDNFQKVINTLYETMLPENMLLIGHSISGSIIKVISDLWEISGIAFDASISSRREKYSDASKEWQNLIQKNKIINIYSSSNIFSGYDKTFAVNGKLAKNFSNPNEYDTACLVTATCSKTMKYFPLCKQVLSQGGDDSDKKFNEILDASKYYFWPRDQ